MDRLMTVTEVATLLQLSQGHVRRLARRKEVPSIKIGELIRFEPMAIMDWLKEKKNVDRKETD